ncbi:hypothetical protein D9M72_506720 [compost metagenome]
MLAVDRAHHHALEEQPDRASCDHRGYDRQCKHRQVQRQAVGLDPACQWQQDRGGHISAKRDEGAVAEVEHIHQAEHQRQAGRDDEDDHAHRQAGNGQRQPGRRAADQRIGKQHQQRRQRQRGPVEPYLGQVRRCGGRQCR